MCDWSAMPATRLGAHGSGGGATYALLVSIVATPEADDTPARAARWIENRPGRGWRPQIDLRELWAYRDVGVILAERDLRARYKQTILGATWVVIQPLLAMVVFTQVLGEGVGVPSDGVPYAAFAMAGLAIWFPWSAAVGRATASLVTDSDLLTKVYFPRLLAPLGAVLASALDLLVALMIAVAVAVIAGVTPPAQIVLLLFIPIAFVAVALGFGLWLSALNVLFRDVGYALGFALQLLFFLTPVVYPVTVLGDGWQTLVAINPVTGLVAAARWMILGTALDLETVAVSACSVVVLTATGLVFFRRSERQFADRI